MLDGTASATAQGVAAQRLTFRRIPADHGRPDDDQRLQADVAAGFELADHPLARYLQARTLFFDQVVVDAIAAGTTQLVAVGAGYDGRSLRYAKPGVRWFELDHPATQADKRARLDRLGVPLNGLTFAPADFTTDDVESCLAATGHDPEQPTLFTSEGVSGYVPLDALRELLAALHRTAAPGSSFAIEVPLEPEGEAEVERRARIEGQVAAIGEPLVSAVARAELRPFLASAGWAVRSAVDPLGVDIDESPRSTAFVIATA